jgi:hypothetical protein
MAKSRKHRPRTAKVRRKMPPPSKVIPDSRRRRLDLDIARIIRRRDDWEDGPDPIPPHSLK